jgi:hypothetical protein
MAIEYGPTTVTLNGKYLGTMTRSSTVREDEKAYYEGYNAENKTDISNKDALCPYPIGHNVHGLRQQWFNGLYDNRFSKYSHIPTTDEHTINRKTKVKDMGKHS